MEITEVRVFPVDEERLKAYVTITIDDCFVVRDLKVINGNNGLFVAMPSKKRKDGTFRDTAHPVNNETREAIEKKVLTAYEQELATPGSTRSTDAHPVEAAPEATPEETPEAAPEGTEDK